MATHCLVQRLLQRHLWNTPSISILPTLHYSMNFQVLVQLLRRRS